MQEVTSTRESTGTTFDQLRNSTLVDTTSKSKAFSDFLGILSQATNSQSTTPQINGVLDLTSASNPAPAVDATGTSITSTAAVATTTASSATTTSTASATASQTRQTASDASASAAKNTPVSREAFEEAKPILAKAGLSDTEIADLSAKVQAGLLTWGQLVQNLGTHMTGAKKAVSLSASETADLQSMFQKMGFAGNVATQMVQSVAQGDGLKVLSSIQNKLSTMADDSSLGVSKDEVSALLKALRLPAETAAKLTRLASGENTVADMKEGLAVIAQTMQDQRAKTSASDTELAKSLGKIMDKDVAKSARDSNQSTSQTSADSSGGTVQFELKTKDTNDTSWFTQHEKNQQKSSDDAWRNFISKVRADDTSAQRTAAATQTSQISSKDSLESLAGRTTAQAGTAAQQTKTDSSQQAKAYEKVAAPKVLDQVSEALLKDLGQGRKQLTVQLDPENLGRVQVMLQVKGKEVSAVLQAEDGQTAAMLSSNMESLRKTLEDQGLTVQSMEVQTGLSSNQQQATFSADQHNQAQQQQDMTRIMTQLRMLRTDSSDMALDMQNIGAQAILADQGLHIIA